MFDPGEALKDSPVRNNEYCKVTAATWEVLMNGYKTHEKKIQKLRAETTSYKIPLALTECHYSIESRNRYEVLSSWAAGVFYARIMNLHERNGDVLKIATMADFCGTRWQVNAVMIPVPSSEVFMMPVAKIMHLYRHHTGKSFINLKGMPDELDVTASRTDNTIFLHVINTSRTKTVSSNFQINNMSFSTGKAFELSTDPSFEIMSASNNRLQPRERPISPATPFTFSSASVTVIELSIK